MESSRRLGFGNIVDDFEGSSFSFTSGSDADDSDCIEIALDLLNRHHHRDHDRDDDDDQEKEEEECLRISFSSSAALPLPNPKTHRTTNFSDDSAIQETPSPSQSSSTSSSSSSGVYINSRIRRRRSSHDLIPAFNRIQDSLLMLFGFRSLISSRDLLRHANTRKAPSKLIKTPAAETANNNNSSGIVKLFIKLRGIKNIGTLIASVVRRPSRAVKVAAVVNPPHISTTTDHNSKASTLESYRRRLIKPLALDKWSLRKNKDHVTATAVESCRRNQLVGEKSKMEIINMGAVRGVLEAMGITATNINGRKDRKTTRSCPTSIKSSPLHNNNNNNKGSVPSDNQYSYKSYSRENSIQSAIAHCKTSFATATSSSRDISF